MEFVIRRRWLLLAIALVGGVGLLVVRPTRDESRGADAAAPALQPRVAAQAAPSPTESPSPAREAALVAALAREQATASEATRTIARLEAERDALSDQEAGKRRPLAFPPGLPADFEPARFKEIVADAAKQCGLNVKEVDCSEFPCVAWVRANGDAGTFSMSTCAVWDQSFGSTMLFRNGDAVALVPVEEGHARAIVDRASSRNQSKLDAYGQEFSAPVP